MNYATSALRIVVALALLAILLPIFFYVGIAAFGLALVAIVIGAIARPFLRNRTPFDGETMRTYRHARPHREPAGNGVIIDHE